MLGVIKIKSRNKVISDYISILDSRLKSYEVRLRNLNGQYEIYEPFESIKKPYNVQILNKHFPFIAIDDVIKLKQGLKYHITKQIQINDDDSKETEYLCYIHLWLNVFQLKKELKDLRKKGYKMILESADKDLDIKGISAIKKKKFSKKIIDKKTHIERDFLEVYQKKQVVFTISGHINKPTLLDAKNIENKEVF